MMRGHSLRSFLPAVLATLPVSLLAACSTDVSTDDEEMARAEQAIVDTTAPVGGASFFTSIPALPGLVSGAYPVEGAVTDTGSTAIHGGVHFNGRDLAGPDVEADQDWLDATRGDGHSATASFPGRIADAMTHGESMETKMDAGAIDQAFSKLKAKGGVLTEDLIQTEKRGFQADRARWKKQDTIYTQSGYLRIPTAVRYEDPKHYQEIRLRGARQYCAAMETARQQGGELTSMGEQVAASFEVFGKTIDVLVLEPTAVVSPPQRYTGDGANDGAQAFAVPLLLGNKITPIRGIGLPGLGEVRSPLTLVSGDSEVLSRQITNPGFFGAPRTYQTVTHGSGFVTTHKGFDASLPNIKLFKVGPIDVYLRIALGLHIGDHEVGSDSLLAGAPAGWPGARDGSPAEAAFFQTYAGRTHYDGDWTVNAFAPTSSGLSLNASTSAARWIPAFDPFVAKALQDDDHVIRKVTSASLAGSIGASGGVEYKKGKYAIGAKLEVDGGLKGTAGIVHTVRDGAYGEMVPAGFMTHMGKQLQPETGVLVTPSTMAQVDFVSRGVLKIYVKMPVLGQVGFTQVLYDINAPLAKWESDPWAETHRLRMGTGANTGDAMKQPVVASHLPNNGHYASFPQGVDTCLSSDPGEIPPEPEPCEPTDDGGQAPSANLCVFAKSVPNQPFWVPVCGSVDGYVQSLGSLTNEQRACVESQLAFTCGGVSMEQWTADGRVVSRVVDLEDPIVMDALGETMEACGLAFGGTPDAVTDLFGFGACDGKADLWGDDMIRPDEGWQTPTDPGPGTCQ